MSRPATQVTNLELGRPNFVFSIPDTDAYYVKPFIRKTWSPIGATVLYAEWGQYNDQFANLVGFDLENGFRGAPSFPGCSPALVDDCFVVGSEVERWGLGVVQEIDAAAMHLWARWQHQELDVDLAGFGNTCTESPGCRFSAGTDDWELFQAGGIIFF